MTGFLVPDHFVKEPMTEFDVMVASIFLGATITLALFSAATAVKQSNKYARKSRRINAYIWMIWGQWLANNSFAVVSFLYLRAFIEASFWLWFTILVLWVFQSQLIIQIIANRISLLIMVKSRATKLKWTIFGIMTVIYVSVFIIWIPARLEISPTWIRINSVWDRIEKCIFLIIDLGLNIFFIYLVRDRLITAGLTKYVPLFRFNIAMAFVSISFDVMLIGLMSLPNDLLYLQFQSVAYAVKLHIEMNMAYLITKVVRASNMPDYDLTLHDISALTGATKSSERTARNSDNIMHQLTQGANNPYQSHLRTRIELGSDEDITAAGMAGSGFGLGGIQKTTVVTQMVDKPDGGSARRSKLLRPVESVDGLGLLSSTEELRLQGSFA